MTLILKLFLFFISVSMSFFLVSCRDKDNYMNVPEEVQGYKPVYFDTSQNIFSLVYSTAPMPVQVAGKIYIFKNFLFVGEPGKGVHVFDNIDPANPVPVAFINIPYNFDIAVKDSIMYADTYMGLVVINISAIPDIQVLQFIKSLSNSSTGTPPLPGENTIFNGTRRISSGKIYFECVDFSKGVVVGWESATLRKPKCYQSTN